MSLCNQLKISKNHMDRCLMSLKTTKESLARFITRGFLQED